MKSILHLVFSLISFCAVGQHTGKINLVIEDSRITQWRPFTISQQIILSKEGDKDPFIKINTWKQKDSPVKLDSIPVGAYNLAYANYYDQKLTKKITVQADSIIYLHISVDSLTSYPQNSLIKMVAGDSLAVNYASYGCFSQIGLRIIIKKNETGFLARLYFRSNITVEGSKFNSGFQTVVMTQENLNDFIRFENELNYAREGGCTQDDHYEIISKQLNIKKVDGSCRWNGFDHLRRSIFGEIRY